MKTTTKKTAKKKTVTKKAAGSRGPRPRAQDASPEEAEALKARLAAAVPPANLEPNPAYTDAVPEWSPDLPDPDDDYIPPGCEPPGSKGKFRDLLVEAPVLLVETMVTPEPPTPEVAPTPTQPVQALPGASQEAKKGSPTESAVASLEHFIETLHQADDAIKFLTKKARLLAPKDRRILADRRTRIQNTSAQLKVQLNARLQQGEAQPTA